MGKHFNSKLFIICLKSVFTEFKVVLKSKIVMAVWRDLLLFGTVLSRAFWSIAINCEMHYFLFSESPSFIWLSDDGLSNSPIFFFTELRFTHLSVITLCALVSSYTLKTRHYKWGDTKLPMTGFITMLGYSTQPASLTNSCGFLSLWSVNNAIWTSSLSHDCVASTEPD